jgi:hypothetical protein
MGFYLTRTLTSHLVRFLGEFLSFWASLLRSLLFWCTLWIRSANIETLFSSWSARTQYAVSVFEALISTGYFDIASMSNGGGADEAVC